MSRGTSPAAAGRRGSALLSLLVLAVVVQAILAALLLAVLGRARLVGAQRSAIEAQLVAQSVLAEGRVHFATATVLPEGETHTLSGSYPGGWQWELRAIRQGDLVVLRADASRRIAPDRPWAGARGTLLLRRGPGDSLRHLPGD